MSEKIRGSQVDIFAPGGSMDRNATQQFVMRLAGTGGLQVGGSGLEVKTNGILSGMIVAGAILGPHVGFVSADIPDASAIGGPTIEASLDTVSTELALRLKRDGTSPMTGDLNMNGFKVSGMADGASQTDAVTLQQLQDYVTLGQRWLYPCGYAGVGLANGCLMPTGKVRASQTFYMSAVPNAGNTFTIDGATITFQDVPGANIAVRVPASIPQTMTNLIAALNACTNLTTTGPALGTISFSLREQTVGQTGHLVWKGHDVTPASGNNLICATTAAGIVFDNIDPVTSGGRLYGGYNSVQDAGTIQGRFDNGVYMYDIDNQDWTLIFANPGSDFFTSASGDAGGTIASGLNGNLFVKGGTGIDTVSTTASGPDPTPGVRLTINHGDIGTDTAQYHAEESIRLNTAYGNMGTALGAHQDDFNAVADALIGDARRTALRNVLVNSSFITDPTGATHNFVGGASALACMPGWAVRDNGAAGNTATIDLDLGPPTPEIGGNLAKIDVTALGGTVPQVFFYQPIIGGEQYKGKRVTFRASVYAGIGQTPRLFIEDSTMGAPITGTPHSGSAAQWENLYVNTTIASTATWVRVGVRFDQTGVQYVDACSCVFGANYTSMVFMPRPEVEDLQLISSMYQKIQWATTVWAVAPSAAYGGEVTMQFSPRLIRLPAVGDITLNVTTDPAVITSGAVDPASLTVHGLHFDLGTTGVYTAQDVIKGDIVADVRPT